MQSDIQDALDNLKDNERKAKYAIVLWLSAIGVVSILFFWGATEYSKTQGDVDALKTELTSLAAELTAFKEQAKENQIRSQAIVNEIASLRQSIEALNDASDDAQRALYVVIKYLKNIPLTLEEQQIKANVSGLAVEADDVAPEIFLLQGVKSFEDQDFVNANLYFNNALESEDTKYIAKWGLGRILFTQRQFKAAKQAYDEAMASPDDTVKSGVLVDRGLTWVRLHNDSTPLLNNAIEDYEQAIALGNHFPSVYRRLGLVELRTGAIEKAKTDFEKAVASSSNDRELASAIENKALVSLHEAQWEEAITHSKLVLRVYPRSEWNWAIRTIAASKAGYDGIMYCSMTRWLDEGGNQNSALRYYVSEQIWKDFKDLLAKYSTDAKWLCTKS